MGLTIYAPMRPGLWAHAEGLNWKIKDRNKM